MARLSIILTFFDETAFVDMAIGSVLSQPIDDLELIIVNDNPARFRADYFDSLNLPANVQVVHHPVNKGLSAARNTGLAAATAPLVGFLDGDDYYVTDGLAQQLQMAENSNADITHAPCYISRPGSPELEILRRDRLLFDTPNIGAGLLHFEEAQFITSSWASLYRRDFLDAFNLRFDEDQPKFEDRLFVLHTVTAARKIATLGIPARVWRQRAGSISVTRADPVVHRLQLQLIEKCLTHMRAEVDAKRLPPRFEKRELFNTVSRLIWDMDIIDPIVAGDDPEYAEFADRIMRLLGHESFGHAVFDDPVLTHISRVGMRTRLGFISRTLFFDLHKALRHGEFAQAQAMLANARTIKAPKRAKPPASVDADVIVHFGMHKTGSTYLQHHLVHYRKALLETGILFPHAGLQNDQTNTIRQGGLPGHFGLVTGLREAGKHNVWANLRREVNKSNAQTVVISCENMLFPLSGDRDTLLPLLMEHLGMFRSIRAVAYVRRPDLYVEALYKEIVANGRRMGSRSLQEFMVDHGAPLTNLPALFAPIEAATGQPVALGDFDTAVRAQSLWPDFVNLCGLPRDLPALPDVPRYPSAGRNGTEAARIVNTLIDDEVQRQRVLRDLFIALPPEPDSHTILSPPERLALIDSFQQASGAFAAARGYAPDFGKMRKSVPKRWKPPAGMDTHTLNALRQSRLRAERPPQPAPSQRKPRGNAEPTLVTLRIKPRPWVMRVLNWRPFR